MISCHKCDSYKRGAGSKTCLQCPKYRDIQKKSNRRPQIIMDILPQAIIEQVADHRRSDGMDVITAIRQMPVDLVTVITLRYFAGLKTDEIAEQLKQSTREIHRRMAQALTYLRRHVMQ